MTHPAPNVKSHDSAVGLWDRAALITLAALAFALSYNALRQTAAAAHVQGPLTYAFPLIIDGFIAYGVRALLILRRARILARAYAWVLFTAATGASTWANVLHGIRLNEQTTAAQGLRLSDRVVGALAVIAPLALAGVVHLYILIIRETTTSAEAATGPEAGTTTGTPIPEPDPNTARPMTVHRPIRVRGAASADRPARNSTTSSPWPAPCSSRTQSPPVPPFARRSGLRATASARSVSPRS